MCPYHFAGWLQFGIFSIQLSLLLLLRIRHFQIPHIFSGTNTICLFQALLERCIIESIYMQCIMPAIRNLVIYRNDSAATKVFVFALVALSSISFQLISKNNTKSNHFFHHGFSFFEGSLLFSALRVDLRMVKKNKQ
jgi:hypothetical protein